MSCVKLTCPLRASRRTEKRDLGRVEGLSQTDSSPPRPLAALVRYGMVNREDLALFQFADDLATALGPLQAGIATEPEAAGWT